jgi:hypothetical protein
MFSYEIKHFSYICKLQLCKIEELKKKKEE